MQTIHTIIAPSNRLGFQKHQASRQVPFKREFTWNNQASMNCEIKVLNWWVRVKVKLNKKKYEVGFQRLHEVILIFLADSQSAESLAETGLDKEGNGLGKRCDTVAYLSQALKPTSWVVSWALGRSEPLYPVGGVSPLPRLRPAASSPTPRFPPVIAWVSLSALLFQSHHS